MKIQAIIFDQDNTLLYYDGAVVAQSQAQVQSIAPELPPDAIIAGIRSWQGPWPRTYEEETSFWRALLSNLASQYSLNESMITTLIPILLDFQNACCAFDDALFCLPRLRAHGFKLALLTNSDFPNTHRPLIHVGINPNWFEVLLSHLVIGAQKPDLKTYHYTTNMLNLPPSACLFVDDQLGNVTAACSAGLHGILLDRKQPSLVDPYILHNLYDIMEMLSVPYTDRTKRAQ